MSTIGEVAEQIVDRFGLHPEAALSAARVYYSQIRYLDHDESIAPADVPVDQDVDADTAEFIIGAQGAEISSGGPQFGDEQLSELARLRDQISAARDELADLERRRDELIVAAANAGVRVPDLSEHAGVTAARVYQIKAAAKQ